MTTKYLGIDIGGANIKLADSSGYATTVPFALWREPDRLREMLLACLTAAPAHDAIAASTTGELADCFATKREGIRAIYTALARAADSRPVAVYLTNGRFVTPAEAIAAPYQAAASNWHALAQFAGRYTDGGNALLIDVGSTTTDIIPLVAGNPPTRGLTDTERLLSGELVYTGVTRTPVAALVDKLPWRGRYCPIARELFATTRDAHLILDNCPEAPDDTETADGRPATRAAARDRLARMIGADRQMFDIDDAIHAALTIAAAQREVIAAGIRQVAGRFHEPPAMLLVSGQGEFLAGQVLDQIGLPGARVSLQDRLGSHVSQAAAAYALAVLAGELSGPPVCASTAASSEP